MKIFEMGIIALALYSAPLSVADAQSTSEQQRDFLAIFDQCWKQMDDTELQVVQNTIGDKCTDRLRQIVPLSIENWRAVTAVVSATPNSGRVVAWVRPPNARRNIMIDVLVEPPVGHAEFVQQLVAINLKQGEPVLISGTLSNIPTFSGAMKLELKNATFKRP